MINIIADLHTHTNVSHHAFNTITEMINRAKDLNMFAIAITNHTPAMTDSAHRWHFSNLVRLEDKLDDMWVLKGAELNVLDVEANLDFSESDLTRLSLDWAIASIHHEVVGGPLSFSESTQLWLNIANNPYIDMIGHSELEIYKYDYDLVTKEFEKNNKVVELNAASTIVRPGNEENLLNLAIACKKNNTKIAVNTDAHSIYNLGNYSDILNMLTSINFPKELIINSSIENLIDELILHNKKIGYNMKKEYDKL